MNPFKRYPTINRSALLLSLLVVQSTAFAAPPLQRSRRHQHLRQ